MCRLTTRLSALFGVVALLTGCATTTHYRNAVHPQYGQTEFDRDWYGCRRENTRPKVSSVIIPKLGTYDAEMVVDEDMARSCLAARGWRPATATTPQAPPASKPTSPPQVAAVAPVPDEKARTERVQRFAREQLAKPYVLAPFACDDGGWSSVKNYVVDLAPWVEAAGLRKGDRLLSFGDISLAQYDTATEAWSKLTRADNITVHVDRGGKESSVQLPCRDSSQTRQAIIATLQAISAGQWQACVDGTREYARITRVTSAVTLRLAWECMRERDKAARQAAPEEYWRTLHAWATKAIEEAHYRPTGLSETRTAVLDAADVLEKNGHSRWAADIRQQLAVSGTSSKQ